MNTKGGFLEEYIKNIEYNPWKHWFIRHIWIDIFILKYIPTRVL